MLKREGEGEMLICELMAFLSGIVNSNVTSHGDTTGWSAEEAMIRSPTSLGAPPSPKIAVEWNMLLLICNNNTTEVCSNDRLLPPSSWLPSPQSVGSPFPLSPPLCYSETTPHLTLLAPHPTQPGPDHMGGVPLELTMLQPSLLLQ